MKLYMMLIKVLAFIIWPKIKILKFLSSALGMSKIKERDRNRCVQIIYDELQVSAKMEEM